MTISGDLDFRTGSDSHVSGPARQAGCSLQRESQEGADPAEVVKKLRRF
jgi:hypothetical protein